MGKKWTSDQQSAIYAKWRNEEKTQSQNILVNAAAGSGKTAVLVERIINKLCCDENSPDRCDADSLLVVTFTNAAAKEMQQRISDALQKKLADSVAENDTAMTRHLKKQLSLIYSADITTIDAFCLKIVKNYFHLLQIDPAFSIVDKAQGDMLKDEAMEEMFEEYYGDEEFIRLLTLYSDNRDDAGLADTILKIYEFTRSIPNPHEWLDEKCNMFLNCNENSPWFEVIERKIPLLAHRAYDALGCALQYMISHISGIDENLGETEILSWLEKNPPDEGNDFVRAFGKYYTAIYSEYLLYKQIAKNHKSCSPDMLKEFKFITVGASKDKELAVTDKDIIEMLKNFRNEAKDIYKKSILPLCQLTEEENFDLLSNEIYPVISLLCKFTVIFEKTYNKKKLDKNIYEFSDIEHKCLELFNDFPEVCEELKEKYTEILMDEYQDSNALQEAIFTKISTGDNLFMVGDMKQSIYRFRSSDPTLFKSKCDSFIKDSDAHDRKIVLSKNFRSRKEVLESINSVFEAVMTEGVGGLVYDEDQRLNHGDLSYEDKNADNCGGYKSECYVILNKNSYYGEEEVEKLSDVSLEARFIAKKIKELKDSGYLVRDKQTVRREVDGQMRDVEETVYRKIQNRDIAIIMSSCKNISKVFSEELSALGIESYTQTGGYFDRLEIRMAVALLKFINNPYNDISLISVMRSPVFGFTDDELCIVRKCSNGEFYEAVKACAKIESFEDEEEKITAQKCINLIEKLNIWRGYTQYMSCDRLIWTLYEETGLYSFCVAVYGEDAGTNLRLLFTRAKGYETSGYKGIFNFIRYIDKLKKKEEDLSQAVVFGEDSDVVRIMTIHKSKGLEFPVVFAARCGAKFNTRDTSGHLLLDKELGFGPDYINYEKSIYALTTAKKAVSDKINTDSTSEEMRKLYVSLTRAKEKLIVTSVCDGTVDTPKDEKQWCDAYDEELKKVKEYATQDVKRFIDWIAPVSIYSENWIHKTVKYYDAVKKPEITFENTESTSEASKKKYLVSDMEYPYKNSVGTGVKLSVTQLKNLSQLDRLTELVEKPDFLCGKKELTGAQKGTALHYVMQKYVPSENISTEEVGEFIKSLYAKEEMTREEAECVNPQDVVDFYNSEIGRRILKSDRVFREASFEIEVPAEEIFGSSNGETVIVQGIIDCYFYEGDEIVIVDYKSDYYNDVMEIKQKYQEQLNYYSKAIEKILKTKVKNKYIYLFFTKNMIQC